jgi:hypothetical protein
MSAVTSGRGRTRWIVGAVVVLHGLLHLLGAATGLGWSTVSSLSQPVGGVAGGIWLVVALLLVLAGLLLALAARWWWVVSSVAAVASQAVIATSWPDARVGTVVNVALLGAAVYGWASQGPRSLGREYVTWTVLGPRRVHADFTRGLQTIGADLIFNEHDELVDFVSDDRLAGSNDGRTFTPRRWSTPLTDYRTIGGSRLATHGDARWGGPDPQSSFSYLELTIDDIAYNVASDITSDITSDSAEVTHPSSPRMPQHH